MREYASRSSVGWSDFEQYSFEAERFVDCGDDVLVVAREHGRGAASGASVSSRIYAIYTFRGSKITRYREFYDPETAKTPR